MSADDSPDDKVIKVDFAALRVRESRGPQPFTRGHKGKPCAHKVGFVLDEQNRTVECKSCNEVVNAYDALLLYTDRWDRIGEEWERLRREIAVMEADIDRLRKDKSNVRRSKDGGAAVFEVDPMQYGARHDAGVGLGNQVLHHIRQGKPILFMPKVKT